MSHLVWECLGNPQPHQGGCSLVIWNTLFYPATILIRFPSRFLTLQRSGWKIWCLTCKAHISHSPAVRVQSPRLKASIYWCPNPSLPSCARGSRLSCSAPPLPLLVYTAGYTYWLDKSTSVSAAKRALIRAECKTRVVKVCTKNTRSTFCVRTLQAAVPYAVLTECLHLHSTHSPQSLLCSLWYLTQRLRP